jgi:hypothetical protein
VRLGSRQPSAVAGPCSVRCRAVVRMTVCCARCRSPHSVGTSSRHTAAHEPLCLTDEDKMDCTVWCLVICRGLT